MCQAWRIFLSKHFIRRFQKLKAGCQLKTQFRLLLQKHVVRLVDSVRLHPRSVHHTHLRLNLGKYIRVCFEYKFQIWQNLVIDLVYPFPFWRSKTYLWWHFKLYGAPSVYFWERKMAIQLNSDSCDNVTWITLFCLLTAQTGVCWLKMARQSGEPRQFRERYHSLRKPVRTRATNLKYKLNFLQYNVEWFWFDHYSGN